MTDVDVYGDVPAGNWMARQLRLVNDDSRKLFPSTAGSVRSHGKFDSNYKIAYRDFPEGALEVRLLDKEKQELIQKKRETIADILFGSRAKDEGMMFSNWKIPQRLVDEKGPATNINILKTATPRATTPQKVQTPRVIRQSTLPEIHRTVHIPHPALTNSAQLPKMSSSRKPCSALPHTAQSLPTPPSRRSPSAPAKHEITKEEMRESLQPHSVGMAEDWMKKAPHMDRKVIEKILRMQERKSYTEHALRKTLLPDARRAVEDWLRTANEAERQVALKFFTSIAGSKLVGTTAEEQKTRLQQVINTLKTSDGLGTPVRSTRRSFNPDASDSRLRYIRLLDPHTRANKWQHTTWHHLPEYRDDDKVDNWSSVYIRPHAPVPHHFVIHPDWG